MRIVIVGGGEVGETIAASLSREHEVVIVERRPERADELNYTLDVLAIEGDGTDVDSLRAADVVDADMLLATTDDDETNLLAAGTAKALSDLFTVARVEDTKYLRAWRVDEGAYGVDYMVATDLLTAETIVRVVGLPTARDSDLFAGGLVHMAEFELTETSPVAGQSVAEADRFESLTFAAIIRSGEVEIPDGGTRLRGGDRIVVIGSPTSVQSFAEDLAPEAAPGSETEVVVVGGSEIGFHVARLLSERGLRPRLIEADPERAREIAEALPGAMVMGTDATDLGFLEREHVGEADVLVSVLDNDERNLLQVLLANRLGVERTVAIIEQPSYTELFEAVGLDVGLSPRSVIAEEITQFTQSGNMENVAFIETDKAEVIEVEVGADSVVVDRPIREAVAELPDGVVIGAVTRGGEMVTPRGGTVIRAGDHVVVFAAIEVADEVAALL